MPPRSPLPQRNGLDAAWLRTPDRHDEREQRWPFMGDWLHDRLSEHIDVPVFLRQNRIVYESGDAARWSDPYQPHTFVWFHRDLAEEKPVPGAIHIVHRDERIVVIDKPPFLSSIPRGQHVQQSVVVRLRDELGMPELSPLHRLDRVTSGLLVMATEKRWRGDYQTMFQHGTITKVYRALATYRAELAEPITVRNHLVKHRGQMQAEIVPDALANSESLVECETVMGDSAIYRLTPKTGRTHQLRMHMLGLGAPIHGDPLYPVVRGVPIDDFSTPLQLLASELGFADPIDGEPRHFTSVRTLPLQSEA